MNNIFRIIFLCIAVTYSAFSFAAINCYSWLITGTELPSNIFKSNAVGTEVRQGWGLASQQQSVICNNTTGNTSSVMHLKADMGTLPVSDINTGYYKLTDDIDVRAIYNVTAGFSPASSAAPFSIVKRNVNSLPAEPYSNRTITLDMPIPGGYAYFKLRRTVTGGSIQIPAGITVSSVFLAYADTGGVTFGAKPLVSTRTEASTLTFPSKCTINAGADLNIDFGSVNSDFLSTSAGVSDRNYKVINPSFVCTGSVVDASSLAVRLKATSSTFSNTLIASTIAADLGIAMMAENKVVKPGDSFQVSSRSGRGTISVGFVPVKRSGQNVSGNFTATATLVIVFP